MVSVAGCYLVTVAYLGYSPLSALKFVHHFSEIQTPGH
jgi:hypothetical protein